jgi:hypothetical protein
MGEIIRKKMRYTGLGLDRASEYMTYGECYSLVGIRGL